MKTKKISLFKIRLTTKVIEAIIFSKRGIRRIVSFYRQVDMRKKHILVISLTFILAVFANPGCDLVKKLTEHEIIVENNMYLQGTTSSEGFVNLMDYGLWRDNKDKITEVTEVIVEYKVTRNGTPSDITVKFYFGEFSPTTLLGSTTLAQDETHSSFVTLPLNSNQNQLFDLILRKDAFWYSIQGNTDAADADFEPVRITVRGTFEII